MSFSDELYSGLARRNSCCSHWEKEEPLLWRRMTDHQGLVEQQEGDRKERQWSRQQGGDSRAGSTSKGQTFLFVACVVIETLTRLVGCVSCLEIDQRVDGHETPFFSAMDVLNVDYQGDVDGKLPRRNQSLLSLAGDSGGVSISSDGFFQNDGAMPTRNVLTSAPTIEKWAELQRRRRERGLMGQRQEGGGKPRSRNDSGVPRKERRSWFQLAATVESNAKKGKSKSKDEEHGGSSSEEKDEEEASGAEEGEKTDEDNTDTEEASQAEKGGKAKSTATNKRSSKVGGVVKKDVDGHAHDKGAQPRKIHSHDHNKDAASDEYKHETTQEEASEQVQQAKKQAGSSQGKQGGKQGRSEKTKSGEEQEEEDQEYGIKGKELQKVDKEDQSQEEEEEEETDQSKTDSTSGLGKQNPNAADAIKLAVPDATPGTKPLPFVTTEGGEAEREMDAYKVAVHKGHDGKQAAVHQKTSVSNTAALSWEKAAVDCFPKIRQEFKAIRDSSHGILSSICPIKVLSSFDQLSVLSTPVLTYWNKNLPAGYLSQLQSMQVYSKKTGKYSDASTLSDGCKYALVWLHCRLHDIELKCGGEAVGWVFKASGDQKVVESYCLDRSSGAFRFCVWASNALGKTAPSYPFEGCRQYAVTQNKQLRGSMEDLLTTTSTQAPTAKPKRKKKKKVVARHKSKRKSTKKPASPAEMDGNIYWLSVSFVLPLFVVLATSTINNISFASGFSQ